MVVITVVLGRAGASGSAGVRPPCRSQSPCKRSPGCGIQFYRGIKRWRLSGRRRAQAAVEPSIAKGMSAYVRETS
ncbi:MAG: hypothetical protein MZV70_37655 [Desulfobacterales bacterium]|nr:hypothetical protein [Desulfobacterales bacterium]